MIDWQHIAETGVTLVVGVMTAYTAIKVRLAVLEAADAATDKRLDRVDTEVNRAHSRIDTLVLKR